MLDRLAPERVAHVQAKFLVFRAMLPWRRQSYKSEYFQSALKAANELVQVLRVMSGRAPSKQWSDITLYDLLRRWRRHKYELTALHEQGLALRKKSTRATQYEIAARIGVELAETNPHMTARELTTKINAELRRHFGASNS